jgi:hypothetical protein
MPNQALFQRNSAGSRLSWKTLRRCERSGERLSGPTVPIFAQTFLFGVARHPQMFQQTFQLLSKSEKEKRNKVKSLK